MYLIKHLLFDFQQAGSIAQYILNHVDGSSSELQNEAMIPSQGCKVSGQPAAKSYILANSKYSAK